MIRHIENVGEPYAVIGTEDHVVALMEEPLAIQTMIRLELGKIDPTLQDVLSLVLPQVIEKLHIKGSLDQIVSFVTLFKGAIHWLDLQPECMSPQVCDYAAQQATVRKVGLVLTNKNLSTTHVNCLVNVIPRLDKISFHEVDLPKEDSQRLVHAIQDRQVILPELTLDPPCYFNALFYAFSFHLHCLKVKKLNLDLVGQSLRRWAPGMSQNAVVQDLFLLTVGCPTDMGLLGKLLESNTALRTLHLQSVPLDVTRTPEAFRNRVERFWNSLQINCTLKQLKITGLGGDALDWMIASIPKWQGLQVLDLSANRKQHFSPSRLDRLWHAVLENTKLLEISFPSSLDEDCNTRVSAIQRLFQERAEKSIR
jgi:hypothetical protein